MKKALITTFLIAAVFLSVFLSRDITDKNDLAYFTPSRFMNPRSESFPTESPQPSLYDTARFYDDRTVSFVGVGDNVIHPNIFREAARRGAETERGYDFKPMYSDIAEIISMADVAFINQETLMAGEEYGFTGYPKFNTPQALGYDLCELGFDVINIANNHICDQGTSGLVDTISFWEGLDVTLIGGYRNASDYDNIRLITVNDITIAFLSYTFSTNGIRLYPEDGYEIPILPYLDEEDIRRQTALAKESAEAVIVSVHWGDENKFEVNAEQKKYASIMAECGVDVIVGHHPHVLQPIEWLDRPDGKRTLCIWSLGNIVSTMENGFNMAGGIIDFDIVRRSGNISIENVSLIPTVFHYGKNFFGTHIYLLEDYSESLAAVHGTQNYGNLDTYEQLVGYVRENIAAEFLSETINSIP